MHDSAVCGKLGDLTVGSMACGEHSMQTLCCFDLGWWCNDTMDMDSSAGWAAPDTML
jgi:hypothetical protein